MVKIEKNRAIALISLVLIAMVGSFIMYGRNKDKVFKDEYMKNIFVEENSSDETNMDNKSVKEVSINTEVPKEEKKSITVEIKGEVLKPDVYIMEEGSIIKELIDKAGGVTSEADISRVNRADLLKNHQLIVISNKNDSQEGIQLPIAIETVNKEDSIININTATLEELKKINGVGDSKAQKILEYREKNGGFKSIEEIKNVDGIGDKTFENMKSQITS